MDQVAQLKESKNVLKEDREDNENNGQWKKRHTGTKKNSEAGTSAHCTMLFLLPSIFSTLDNKSVAFSPPPLQLFSPFILFLFPLRAKKKTIYKSPTSVAKLVEYCLSNYFSCNRQLTKENIRKTYLFWNM